MARLLLLASALACASAYHAVAPVPRSKIAASRYAVAPVMQDDPSPKAVTIGAASVGALLGVWLFRDLYTACIFAAAGAYGSTTTGVFSEYCRNAGEAGAKVYSKTLDINEQYDLLPKTKSALDAVTTAASNIDSNYGITAGIDEQLKISDAVASASAKFDEAKNSVTSKVSDLQAKAE